jgi:coproporphyrinogen III oxidase-like Fe-S oxidoreductase
MNRVLKMKNWACEIAGVEVGKKKGRRNEVSLAMIAADRYAGLGLGAVTYLGIWLVQLNYLGRVIIRYRNDYNANSYKGI